MSDYDFAFYLDTRDQKRIGDIRMEMIVQIGRLLQSDNVDVVILNLTDSPDLKYQIVQEGRLIYEKAPFKVRVEPRILNEYFDFHQRMVRHRLTKAAR